MLKSPISTKNKTTTQNLKSQEPVFVSGNFSNQPNENEDKTNDGFKFWGYVQNLMSNREA